MSLERADSVNTKVVDDAVKVFTLAAFLELPLNDEVGTADSSEYLYTLYVFPTVRPCTVTVSWIAVALGL